MEKVYAEIGIGNKTFLSTEFEKENKEYRISKFVLPKKINEVYIRIWINKKVYIFSSKEGFKIKKKDTNRFKFLLGIGGFRR